MIKRKIIANLKGFKQFWKEKGPFEYAVTSKEFPPILLEPEEWIFSNEIQVLLKSLMQFDKRKMKIVKAPFNPENKSILRPGTIIAWKINNFPEEWNASICDLFVPQGYLTRAVIENIQIPEEKMDPDQVETIFFQCLATRMDLLGYQLFKPQDGSKYAAIKTYLLEWEEDEQDAGLL
ncbi:hypothetical protein [Desulfobacula sp.]